MPLETPINYIPDLNAANPAVSDGLTQGDDHLRGIKAALRNTFGNFSSAPLASSNAEIDLAAHTGQFNAQDGGAGSPSLTFKNNQTAGFYKGARTAQTAIAGRLLGNGAVDVGMLGHFPLAPLGLVSTGGTAGGRWLLCNGGTYNVTDYPDLGAYLGASFGGDGINTFAVPNFVDTGRFLRSFSQGSNPTSASVYQSNQLGSHSHTASTASAGAHSHTATVNQTPHSHGLSSFTQGSTTAGGGSTFTAIVPTTGSTATTDGANANISVTIDTQGAHTHTVTVDAAGGSETRPEAFTVYICIKA